MFLPDWEVLLRWVNVLEQRKANLYSQQKEELRSEVFRSHSCVNSTADLSSPTYMLEDKPEGEAREEQVNDGDADKGEQP